MPHLHLSEEVEAEEEAEEEVEEEEEEEEEDGEGRKIMQNDNLQAQMKCQNRWVPGTVL